MVAIPILALLAQAMVAAFFALPFIFGALFCGIYILLILVNAGFALANGYRRKPEGVALSRRTIIITALVVATLVCGWSLFSIDGRFT